MTAVEAETRRSKSSCKRCFRTIVRAPNGRWVNLSGTGWRCRPTAAAPDQAHDPVDED